MEHVDHARRSAQHCVKALLSAQTDTYIGTYFLQFNLLGFLFFVPADFAEFCWWFSGMIISHTSTQGFLNMKEALEKYGGSSLETMVNISSKYHFPTFSFFSFFF